MNNKNEFDKLEESLYDLYSSNEDIKKEVYQKMTNNKKPKKYAAVVALVAVLGITGIAGASGVFKDVLKFKSDSGRISIYESKPVDKNVKLTHQLEPELQGKLFDKDGNALTEITEDEKFYNKDGEEIVSINYSSVEGKDGTRELLTKKDVEAMKNEFKIEKPLNEVLKYSTFKPVTLPEDKYQYKYAENFAEKYGEMSDYLNLYYEKDGKTIILNQRASNNETAYELGGDIDVEEITHNGIRMAYIKNSSLTYEENDVLIDIRIKEKEASLKELLQIYDDLIK